MAKWSDWKDAENTDIVTIQKKGRYAVWAVFDVTKDTTFSINCTVMGTGQNDRGALYVVTDTSATGEDMLGDVIEYFTTTGEFTFDVTDYDYVAVVFRNELYNGTSGIGTYTTTKKPYMVCN